MSRFLAGEKSETVDPGGFCSAKAEVTVERKEKKKMTAQAEASTTATATAAATATATTSAAAIDGVQQVDSVVSSSEIPVTSSDAQLPVPTVRDANGFEIDTDLQQRLRELPAQLLTQKSLLERFIASRALPPAHVRAKVLWRSFSKQNHGERVEKLRHALFISNETYDQSPDAYAPKKQEKPLVRIHEDGEIVSVLFEKRTRRLFYERETLDRPVCDMMQNRKMYQISMRSLGPEDFDLHVEEERQQQLLEQQQHEEEHQNLQKLRRSSSRFKHQSSFAGGKFLR
jgi:hypothetical protein